jgi:hypothetical protein
VTALTRKELDVESNKRLRRALLVRWAVAVTLLVEGITVYLRFRSGIAATEFIETAPLLLQIHRKVPATTLDCGPGGPPLPFNAAWRGRPPDCGGRRRSSD